MRCMDAIEAARRRPSTSTMTGGTAREKLDKGKKMAAISGRISRIATLGREKISAKSWSAYPLYTSVKYTSVSTCSNWL